VRGVAKVNEEQQYAGSENQHQQLSPKPQELDQRFEAGEGYKVYAGISLLEERDRQRQQLGKKLQELDQKLEASEGYRIYTKVELLKKSYFVFDGNYVTLKHVLDEFEQPMTFLKLWDQTNHDRLDLFMSDIIRLFHNYLAGAETLLDHVGELIEDAYRGTGFAEEYQQRVEHQVERSSLHHFVQDLRNYMVHKGFPFALAELKLASTSGGVQVHSAIRLNVADLRNWEEWSDTGSEHLRALGHNAKLDDIVSAHASIVANLYTWFRKKQSELHHRAFEELAELQGEREHLQQELRRSEDLLELTEKAAGTMREERQRLIAQLAQERERVNRLEADLEKARRPWWRR
jgi:predicted nuclease with TOPRIM domain